VLGFEDDRFSCCKKPRFKISSYPSCLWLRLSLDSGMLRKRSSIILHINLYGTETLTGPEQTVSTNTWLSCPWSWDKSAGQEFFRLLWHALPSIPVLRKVRALLRKQIVPSPSSRALAQIWSNGSGKPHNRGTESSWCLLRATDVTCQRIWDSSHPRASQKK
jgi:hypothetical protein